ncbi:unnamed protein product [Paramecium octaurelia]|uniref:Uncharacterized protein n=1 Tax=Paramecium octaurelia TaxID=43137 RepID=A0A8S1W0U9_PAROT|nr:unnamed protein product [Paramecium octaurelia]
MILLLLIHVLTAYTIDLQEPEHYIYPTEGELYQNYFYTVLHFDELMCKIEPQIPNVQVMNQCEEIFQTQVNEFKSMSSNNAHFINLSYENEVIMYEWKNQIIEQVGESVKIDSSLNFLNLRKKWSFLRM